MDPDGNRKSAAQTASADNPAVDDTTRPDPRVVDITQRAQIRTFLIADVRGYTLFTQERGDEAAAKLAAKFADIARDGVEARGGELLELRGDEALCVFSSARDAIRAAVDLQQRFVDETLDQPELPLTVGIGLDAGEAVPVQGGYRGGALNLAARLCGEARAGEILASREVTHLARRVEGVRYADRGVLSLKGLSEPVAVVAVVSEDVDAVDRLRPFAPPSPPTRKPSRRWAIVVGIALVLALVAISIPLLRSGDDTVEIGTNSVARMNAEDGSLEFASALGQRPGASSIGFGSLWVAEPDRGVVARLDLEDGSVIHPGIRVGNSPAGIAAGEGSMWVTNAADGTVSRINTETNEVSDTLDVGTGPSGIAVGDGALWVADAIGSELLRVDPTTGETQAVPLAGSPSGVAFTPSGVWVTYSPAGIARVDPETVSVTLSQTVGNGPTAVLQAFDSIWVANHLDGTITRLDPATGRTEATIPVGDGPNALTAATGMVWVSSEFDDSVTVVDPEPNAVDQVVPVGSAAASVTSDGDGVWLAVGASAAEHRGGTLTVSSSTAIPSSLDPAVLYDFTGWQILSITNDGLLAYRKVGGPDGATLVPDLASALPQVSADGLSYRFPLRDRITYSTGDPVRAEDFRFGLERAITLSKDALALFRAIDGARACNVEPSSCDLSESIVVDEGSVTIHLARPDPDLPFKLALPFAFPVPVGTPVQDQGLDPVPATGPYMIESAAGDGIELVRNPAFREWSGAAQPDGFVDAISWRFEEDLASAFDRLSAGELDWMSEPPEPQDLSALRAAHPDRVISRPLPFTHYMGMDLREPPFNDVRVRQALNFAIDRQRVVELLGSPTSWQPTCQILPPNFQGYESFCPYTVEPDSGVWSAPDLDRARALIDDADVSGARVTVWINDDPRIDSEIPPERVDVMRYITDVLNDLGLRADLKIVHDIDEYAGAIFAGEAHAYLFGWAPDYPRASNFIELLFRCGVAFNVSHLCSESLDARIDDALRLEATDPGAANQAWTAIDHRLVDEAVWVPLLNPVSEYAFSSRTENVQVHPQWGILLSRVWVQ
jgi:YVTN family beta-propeller protein